MSSRGLSIIMVQIHLVRNLWYDPTQHHEYDPHLVKYQPTAKNALET